MLVLLVMRDGEEIQRSLRNLYRCHTHTRDSSDEYLRNNEPDCSYF